MSFKRVRTAYNCLGVIDGVPKGAMDLDPVAAFLSRAPSCMEGSSPYWTGGNEH